MNTDGWQVELPEGWRVLSGPAFDREEEHTLVVSMGVAADEEGPHTALAVRLVNGDQVHELQASLEFPETFEVNGRTYPCTDRIYRQRPNGGLVLTFRVAV